MSSFLYRKTTLGRNSGGTNTSLYKKELKSCKYIKLSLLSLVMNISSNLILFSVSFDLSFLLENCFNLSKTDIDLFISNKSSFDPTKSFFLLVEKNFRKEVFGRSIFELL